jgi:hypothetical protein
MKHTSPFPETADSGMVHPENKKSGKANVYAGR